jgi:hypothetical protein
MMRGISGGNIPTRKEILVLSICIVKTYENRKNPCPMFKTKKVYFQLKCNKIVADNKRSYNKIFSPLRKTSGSRLSLDVFFFRDSNCPYTTGKYILIDILPVKDSQRIAFEIETGKSGVAANVKKCINAKINRIIIVTTSIQADKKFMLA